MFRFLYIVLLFAICNAEDEVDTENEICLTRNGYYRVPGSCDAYIECVEYQPIKKLCLDGLNYNALARWPMYPCSFPADVPCSNSDTVQLPVPSKDCPRQFGFFPSPLTDANDCIQYRLCSEGRAYDMFCPYGLAFDRMRGRCDWPDQVPGCGIKAQFGFACPKATYDLNGYPLVVNFRHENHCAMFYSCISGRGRLLSCDEGYAFDDNKGRCVEDYMVNCGLRVRTIKNPIVIEK